LTTRFDSCLRVYADADAALVIALLVYKPNDRLPVSMILPDEKDVIAVTWQCSRIGAREIKIRPLGHLRFRRARSPCLRSSTARSYQNKNAGLVGPADPCSFTLQGND
jgi:hypothetical protein